MAGSAEDFPELNPADYVFIPEDLSEPDAVVFGGVHFLDWERKELQTLPIPVHHFGYLNSSEPTLANVDLVNVSLDDLLYTLYQAKRNEMTIFLSGVERGLSVRGRAFQRGWYVGFLAVCGHLELKEN